MYRGSGVSGDTRAQECKVIVTVHIKGAGEKVDNQSVVTSQVKYSSSKLQEVIKYSITRHLSGDSASGSGVRVEYNSTTNHRITIL